MQILSARAFTIPRQLGFEAATYGLGFEAATDEFGFEPRQTAKIRVAVRVAADLLCQGNPSVDTTFSLCSNLTTTSF